MWWIKTLERLSTRFHSPSYKVVAIAGHVPVRRLPRGSVCPPTLRPGVLVLRFFASRAQTPRPLTLNQGVSCNQAFKVWLVRPKWVLSRTLKYLQFYMPAQQVALSQKKKKKTQREKLKSRGRQDQNSGSAELNSWCSEPTL